MNDLKWINVGDRLPNSTGWLAVLCIGKTHDSDLKGVYRHYIATGRFSRAIGWEIANKMPFPFVPGNHLTFEGVVSWMTINNLTWE